eukprot:m.115146 g.115146  ORF g.115146 m.115146 type:complete len:2509 (+) comp37534_c0_seq1:25-7551(+)
MALLKLGSFFLVWFCFLELSTAQTQLARCIDHYKAGKTKDGEYLLEVSSRVVVSVYCKGMSAGKPMEYIGLTQGAAKNYARFYKPTGRESTCASAVPQQQWDKWGSTQFTRLRFDFDSWLVQTDDFAYATSVQAGANIAYGQAGDKFYDLRKTACRKGQFSVDLTSTPYEVDPSIVWSWSGQMEDNLPNTNAITDSSNPRQKVSGMCGGFPGTCFPALSSSKTIAKLKLRLVSSHPCVDSKVQNPCKNYGKCEITKAKAYTCHCLPGWSGTLCEEPEPDTIATGPLSRKADDAKSRATCPYGYTLTDCKCDQSTCDGVILPLSGGEYCDAVNANNRIQVKAVANCTQYNSSLVTTTVTRMPTSGFGGGQNPSYTCPKGSVLIACTWTSPWYRSGRPVKSGLGTITGSKCSANCGISGSKACAIYAKCLRATCPCLNGGTCTGYSSHCFCPEGYVGELCETFDYCAWQVHDKGSSPCQNGATCRSKPANVISTFGGDGTGADCQFPMWWQGKTFSRCVSNCTIGPPWACAAFVDGNSDWIDLGWWNPGVTFTLEVWIRPTRHVAGRKTIVGAMDSCSDWGVALNNGKFAIVYKPVSGCSAAATLSTTAYLNQWHYVVLTVDGNYVTLYVNGTQIGRKQMKSNFIGSAKGFRLGGEICCSNNNYAGYIKNLRVWKRSLGAAELVGYYQNPQVFFNTTENVLSRHLIAHYEFCDNPPQSCHGKDWGYQDWYPSNGDIVYGVHCNVRTFYIRKGVTVTVAPWQRDAQLNSGANGTFQVYAQDIFIEGTLTAQGAGYEGGDRPTAARQSGKQGESFSSSGSTSTGQYQGGGGGGLGDPTSRSYGKPGGGGGYGSSGKSGYDKRNNQAGVGKGGGTYGAGDMRILHLGGGGGSGGNDNSIADNPIGGKGGNGGGGIHLDARNTLHVTGRVTASGDPGQGDSSSTCTTSTCRSSSKTTCWDWCGPGGGGAGGSVYLRALIVDIGTNKVTSLGGRGGFGSAGCGGSGGNGRIRIDYDQLTGSTNPGPAKYKFNNTFNDLATLARESLPLAKITSATDPSVFLGCYQDTVSNRHLKFQTATSLADRDKMTPDYCRQQCYAKGYKYYGVEYAYECFCDNNYGKQGLMGNLDCNSQCLGDKSQMCGGPNRISIYGPVPKRPAQAMVNAVLKCQPWCVVGYAPKTQQKLYGLCNNDGKVTSWDIQCACPVGYTGSRCEKSCPKNKYGLQCKMTCQCKNKGVCDPVSGSCDCPAGLTGATCTTQCPQGKFGPNCAADCKCVAYCTPTNCPGNQLGHLLEAESGQLGARKSAYYFANASASNGTVIKAVGSARFSSSTSSSASTSWLATYTINVPIAGRYYVWLNVYAPHGKADSVYVQFGSGTKYTFHIPNSESFQWSKFGGIFNFVNPGNKQLNIFIREADLQIDQVFLGTDRAASNCNRFSGKCSCTAGYIGTSCDQPCPVGKFGLGCTKSCTCTAQGACDPQSGQCHCLPGYEGANCEKKCSGNTYGTNCNSKCTCAKTGTCNHVTGACSCKIGYTGINCGTVCPKGRFGQNCSKLCACRHGDSCDAVTGKCQCPPGYIGNDCGSACPVGYFGQSCSIKCKCNQLLSSCDHVTGKCVCLPGYRGTNCGLACQGGKCGQDCKTQCTCSKGNCNKASCKCDCWSGWTGAKCDVPCPQGKYGSDCTQSCGCARGNCNRWTGTCTCPTGWKGALCNAPCAPDTFGKGCASSCKCNKIQSSTCDPITGSCTCKPGYTGLFCTVPCPSGTFGSGCIKCNCKNGGGCHNVHGGCDCPPGYIGSTCEQTCPSGVFGYNCSHPCQCKNGASCDGVDGSCTCSPGFSGDLCDSSCPPGTFGTGCNSSCPFCSQGKCNSLTGKCTCDAGYTGAACDQPCPTGAYGDGCLLKCNCVNGVCDNVGGTCTCNDGYKGSSCSVACLVGTYGTGCNLACPRVCNNSLPGCDPTDGHCICAAGWSGPWCSLSCPAGFYGQGCSQSCKSCAHPSKSLICSPHDGSCVCDYGYIGELCDEPCDDGWFGLNCTEQCACPIGRSSCDVSDGSCICKPGFRGDSCQSTCLQGFYGQDCLQSCNCDLRYGSCNPQTGVCECFAGFTGGDCKTVCSDDKWGVDCAEDCLCLFGKCAHATGVCTCFDGVFGQNCDQDCVNGTYGPGCSSSCGCQNGASCNPHTGTCYCLPGYYGHFCESECQENFFGHLCGRQCDCLNGAACNKSTGFCDCAAGYTGTQCELSCPDGFWGPHCQYACGICVNGRCDPMAGGCLCDNGYEGANCTTVCSGQSWGINCKNPCPDCFNNYACDAFTGHCLCGGKEDYCGDNGVCSTGGECQCDPGVVGDNCSQPCPANTYGDGCKSECVCAEGATCSPVDGTCNCPQGKWGFKCSLECDCSGVCDQDSGVCVDTSGTGGSTGGGSSNTVIIVVIAVCCVVAGIVVSIVIYAYLRHRANKEATAMDFTGASNEGKGMTMSGNVRFERDGETVGFGNPIYDTVDNPVEIRKSNPLYHSQDDNLDDNES